MEILFIAKSSRGWVIRRLGPLDARLAAMAAVGLCAFAIAAGLWLHPPPDPHPDIYAAVLKHTIEEQRLEVVLETDDARRHLDALALQLGELRARVVRLDALGARLVDAADLDPEEFDFGIEPPRGGAAEPDSVLAAHRVPDFLADLEVFETVLQKRVLSLEVIESALMGRKIDTEVRPTGRPVKRSWLSSSFGWRNDPTTGKRMFHHGVDFAGRPGSNVIAVASGVVVVAGRYGQYGNMVKIDHGAGLSTLYAHNHKNLVTVGQTVKKGDAVGLIGATGKATGTHVHFEVHKDGKKINPIEFIREAAGGG